MQAIADGTLPPLPGERQQTRRFQSQRVHLHIQIIIFVKFNEVWSILKFWTFLLFPWLRRPFWKFQLQKSTLLMPVTISVKFHPVCRIFIYFLIFWPFRIVSMVTTDILKIPTPNGTSSNVAHRYCEVSWSLEHFEIFEIFGVVSMAT